MKTRNACLRGGLLLLGAGALVLGMSACAPTASETDPAPSDGESSWSTPLPEDVAAKSTEPPESFPLEAFPIPEGATIDDTGEREAGQWFIVFEAADDAAAAELWSAVVDGGGFTESDTAETPEGGLAATLTSDALTVQALTIPNPDDGTVLLSYDISSTAI